MRDALVVAGVALRESVRRRVFVVVLLLSVAFVGNAVRSLQEADMLAVDPIRAGWARLPVFVAELTGIHPTTQGITAQAVLLGLYALGAAWVFGWGPLRQRRAVTEASVA